MIRLAWRVSLTYTLEKKYRCNVKREKKKSSCNKMNMPTLAQWALLTVLLITLLLVVGRLSSSKQPKARSVWQQIRLACENSVKDFKVEIVKCKSAKFDTQNQHHEDRQKHKSKRSDEERIVAADDPTSQIDPTTDPVIPYASCNASNEKPLLTNVVLQAAPYPPIVGQPIVLSMSGNLVQPIVSGTYSGSAKIGFVTVYQTQGALPSTLLPATAGPFTLTQTFTVPKVPFNMSPELKFEARDSNNQLITCLIVQLATPIAAPAAQRRTIQ